MAPLQQVSRHGGPNKCFGLFQSALECMTSSTIADRTECLPLRQDYIECRKHRLETYKMFIVEKHLEERVDLDRDEVGAPYLKRRDFLTPKTLGLADGDDKPILTHKF
ncbi:hypothetical protein KL948_004042 [Ogataea haglerorum]|nr:hypothetical protein KL914_003069 [Ogataea haglerorum]KAG7708113.1 hypothetical protein KL950_002739 [Ogataea haglerorum]KAG7729005.1 hypothetical protein KL948_004042 [Ogataea haglerorum]KAG7758207.1 hypothetical protein KL947_002586 [Ogataea haglerorum]KAG7783491.1 hypothetical protein KL945_005170 [Ogataea haglerorum]